MYIHTILADICIHTHTPITRSLTHSLFHSLTHSLTVPLAHSLTHCSTRSLTHCASVSTFSTNFHSQLMNHIHNTPSYAIHPPDKPYKRNTPSYAIHTHSAIDNKYAIHLADTPFLEIDDKHILAIRS